MTPTIRIDQEVWNELQRRAEPFVDNPNTVIRRLLKLDGGERRRNGPPAARGQRAKPGEVLHRKAYWDPILRALSAMGGEGAVDNVLDRVYQELEKELTPLDRQMLPSGNQMRWRNRAQWARFRMVEAGYLDGDSPRGIWRLTPAGREAAGKVRR